MGGLLLLSKIFIISQHRLHTDHALLINYNQLINFTMVKLITQFCFVLFFVCYVVCTPVGLSRMFTVMGQLLVKPTVSNHLDQIFMWFGVLVNLKKKKKKNSLFFYLKDWRVELVTTLLFCSEKSVSVSHLHAPQRTTNTSPTHPPVCHLSVPRWA